MVDSSKLHTNLLMYYAELSLEGGAGVLNHSSATYVPYFRE